MPKLYRIFESFVCSLGDRLINAKFTYSEWSSIIKKSHLYKNIAWTQEQQRRFDSFFQEHYGKRISNRLHRLYESMNGTYCHDYFPEILYTLKLEKKLNEPKYSHVLCDKSLLNVIWGNTAGVRTANEFVTCCNGITRDSDYHVVSPGRAYDILSNAGKVCIKPTVDTGSGKGLFFPVFHNGIDEKTGESVQKILRRYGRNYTVQEYIQQHDTFSALHPSSLNTIRLITYIVNEAICHVPLAARIGSGKSEVDNIHAGGICVGVEDSGCLKSQAIRLGYGDKNEKFTEHPDTHVIFGKHRLCNISQLISSAYALHAKTPQLGIISWDFTIDSNGIPVLIEANLMGQSIWFPQIVNGCSAFGDNTGAMLELIRDR